MAMWSETDFFVVVVVFFFVCFSWDKPLTTLQKNAMDIPKLESFFLNVGLFAVFVAIMLCPGLAYTPGNETALRVAMFTGYDYNVRPEAVTTVSLTFVATSLTSIVGCILLSSESCTRKKGLV